MSHKINRRTFLKTAAAAGDCALLAHTEAGMPVAHAMPQGHAVAPTILRSRALDEVPPAQVALVKTQDRAAGIRSALEMFGLNPVEGKNVVLKANYNSSDPYPGATHNDALAAFVQWTQDSGAESVAVADRSWEGARTVMKAKGVLDMAEEMGFEALMLNDLPALPENWEWVQVEDGHWDYGFLIARPIWDAECVVATCCLKTHGYGGHYTITLKNAVGIVPKFGPCGDEYVNLMDELHGKRDTDMRKMIAEINLVWNPEIYVVDGIQAFVAGGPMEGVVADTEAILAGTDRVALDAVGVALLRMHGAQHPVSTGPIFETEQIARAAELGIGVASPDQIEIITDDPDSAAYAEQLTELLFAEGEPA
ncbi:MAG: DUF362 domain-containing protein [Anaerolineae bacterium]|nr:DUF362 domain-containing protein [Anaerolineae bacterium]